MDCLKKFFVLYVLITVLGIGVMCSAVHAEKPSAVQLMNDLKSTPFYEHGPGGFYHEILRDTSVLDHSGLVNQLLKIGREGWLKQYLLPLRFEEPGSNPKWFQKEGLSRTVIEYQKILAHIPNETQGHHALELKLYFLGNSVGWNNRIIRQIKKDPETLRILVREGSYLKSNEKTKNELIGGWMNVDQAIYESYRHNQNRIKSSLDKQITDWAWETIKEPLDPLTMKNSAIGILLSKEISKQKIESKFKFDIKYGLSPGPYPSLDKVLEKRLKKAKKFIEQYPKWPIDESKQVDDRHKNQQGKGHDKQKGKGH